ncbi:MAG: hypothetical protein AAF928_02585 [Myxococcota bacterium]
MATPGRSVCGWKTLDDGTPRVVFDEGGRYRPSGPRGRTAPAAALVVPGGVSFHAVASAVRDIDPSLRRVELPVDGRWLVPLTRYAGRAPAPRPPSTDRDADVDVAVVGHRRVRRARGAPRVRLADVRVAPDARATLFLERGNPAGVRLGAAQLSAYLRAARPRVDTFTIDAAPSVLWSDFVRVATVVACYDRGPGEAPHEVIWDLRRFSTPTASTP